MSSRRRMSATRAFTSRRCDPPCTDLQFRGFDGALISEIELTDRISFHGLDADRDTERVFFQAEGFARPAALYRWTPEHGVEPWGSLPVAADPDTFVVEQVRYPSRDGTAIPMFLVRAARTTTTAEYAVHPHRLRRLQHRRDSGVRPRDRGVVRTRRPLRDRRAARRHRGRRGVAPRRHAREQAERVRRLPRRRRLARGSGLDVARPAGDRGRLQRRPARRRGAHAAPRPGPRGRAARCRCSTWCASPQFLIARLWIAEYGDPDVADEFAWLHAYSPYHHVVERRVLSGGAVHDGRGRQPRRPVARPQDGRGRCSRRSTCQDDHRSCSASRSRAGHGQASRCTSRPTSWPTSSPFLRGNWVDQRRSVR